MENNKPKNFKEASLSHIPLELQNSMLKEVQVRTDGLSPLEAIARATASTSPLPQKAEMPQQEQFLSLAVNGNVIKIPADATKGAVVMFMYILATVLSKDKKIAKILKQFNFTMFDANNVQIYPKRKK